jgi:hypothetical protein
MGVVAPEELKFGVAFHGTELTGMAIGGTMR